MTELFNKLLSYGLCKLCAFRYMGVRDPAAYDCSGTQNHRVKSYRGEIVINGEEDEEPAQKLRKSNCCLTCLGLLQQLTENDAIDMICKKVLAEDYDSPTIACAVSLPIAMQLRTHAMNLHLKSEEKSLSILQVVPMKEAWKWACSQRIAAGVNKQASSGAVCDFLVNLHVEYAEDKAECQPLQEIHGDKFVERRRESRKFRGEMFTRQSVEALLDNTEAEKFKLVYSCPPGVPNEAAKYGKVICSHNACFIAGRYNKFSRELSQTPWVVEGDRRMEGSVQELISKSLETIAKSKSSKFLSSGREDVDVRTLGRGRPFAIELADPHRTQFTAEDLAELQKSINKSSNMLIAVRDLQLINKDELVELKSGEEEKCKDYEAFCVSLGAPVDPLKLEALQSMKDIVLSQKTPIRVLHRRPLATRSRTVFSMSATVVDEMHFKLQLRTQAGTYIKEFVHGDFGRTLPNLGTLLGTPVDILALDVQSIELNWPKTVPTTSS